MDKDMWISYMDNLTIHIGFFSYMDHKYPGLVYMDHLFFLCRKKKKESTKGKSSIVRRKWP